MPAGASRGILRHQFKGWGASAMGFSFRKRIKVLPGLTLNLSKSGISTTLGPKGARMTVGGKRGPRVTTGIPGTGVSYSQALGAPRASQPAPRQRSGLATAFWFILAMLIALPVIMWISTALGL